MKRILRSAAFWLLIAEALAVAALAAGPGLEARRVPDTKGYVQQAMDFSWSGALGSYRTVGYPLLLRLVMRSPKDLAPLPFVHLAIFLAGVALFWWGLARCTGRPWLALAGALPLLGSRSLELLTRIQPDMPAVGLALATVGLLLAFSAAPHNRLLAVALGISLFATYQVRPAYLFLIVLVPLAAPVLR
ncbi:MAG: hypothetical protein KDD47_20910, partial [Acidobacteria bacterium]|nr:hypothetical protein [Acidobacteriota bacterium]